MERRVEIKNKIFYNIEKSKFKVKDIRMIGKMDKFDSVSPLDYRYYIGEKEIFNKLNKYVSERSYIKYQASVEAALVETMADIGICTKEIALEVKRVCNQIEPDEVYEEEKKTQHNIRALVNSIRKKLSNNAKGYIHLFVTSSDITDTATAVRFKDLNNKVVIPLLLDLERMLISFSRNTIDYVQIGRTHGQHAEPITFGFALAGYVDRLGNRIEKIKESGNNLRGKISGAVGAYNAFSLLGDKYWVSPDDFEKRVLEKLGLKPARHSTQIVEPEYLTDYCYSIISCFSVLANLCDDIRNLRRSEIEEIMESAEEEKVGSSTMPHKVNPWNFEHIKSLWKEFMPRMITIFMDQISEHQRDLTNSASSRFVVEILVGFIHSVNRLMTSLKKVRISDENMIRNLKQSESSIIAEPLYILLSLYGYPNGYDYIRKLFRKSKEMNKKLIEIAENDEEIKKYFEKINKEQKQILYKPEKYIGLAVEKTKEICSFWEGALLLDKQCSSNN